MLTEERHKQIVEMVKASGIVTVPALTEALGASESTIRRDLVALNKQGLLKKVHGGATRIESDYTSHEDDVSVRYTQHSEEKAAIGETAAALIKKGDFVYIDAGTTTEAIVDALEQNEEARAATYITNGLSTASKLLRKGYAVYILGGQLRPSTEAIVGQDAITALRRYNFTLGFFGTNGVDVKEGFTTPDIEEAGTKSAALEKCKKAYILTDPTKFGRTTPVCFAAIDDAIIITTRLPDAYFRKYTEIMEVNP